MLVINEESLQVPPPTLSARAQQHIDGANIRAQAQCLSLTTLMYKKLPKELRDLVYSHLCLDDRQIPIGPYYHFRKYEPSQRKEENTYSDTQYFPRTGDLQTDLSDGKTRIDHDVYPPDDLLLPHNHVFNPSYMDAKIVLETLTAYYEGNSFSVCNIEGGLDDLCTAVTLSTDRSAADFVPIDHIRNLQIRIKFEHSSAATRGTESHPGFRLREFGEQERLLQSTIESLQKFRSRIQTAPPHDVNIEIVCMSDIGRNKPCALNEFAPSYVANFLQTFRNVVYELLHDRGHAAIRVTHQDEYFVFPKNYTGLFRLSKQDWEFEKSRQQPNRDWSADFWVLPVLSGELSESEMAEVGGYCCDLTNDRVYERWGVERILAETQSLRPIKEGPSWPTGRPYNPEAGQALFEDAVRTYPEQVEQVVAIQTA